MARARIPAAQGLAVDRRRDSWSSISTIGVVIAARSSRRMARRASLAGRHAARRRRRSVVGYRRCSRASSTPGTAARTTSVSCGAASTRSITARSASTSRARSLFHPLEMIVQVLLQLFVTVIVLGLDPLAAALVGYLIAFNGYLPALERPHAAVDRLSHPAARIALRSSPDGRPLLQLRRLSAMGHPVRHVPQSGASTWANAASRAARTASSEPCSRSPT